MSEYPLDVSKCGSNYVLENEQGKFCIVFGAHGELACKLRDCFNACLEAGMKYPVKEIAELKAKIAATQKVVDAATAWVEENCGNALNCGGTSMECCSTINICKALAELEGKG